MVRHAVLLTLYLLQITTAMLGLKDDEQPRREVFYVGGQYVNITSENSTNQYMVNQIYVEKLIPRRVTQDEPLVFIAGTGQTGTNFLDTPDGRPGWASYFLSKGYIVYLSDQPERGRSPWLPGTGTVASLAVADVEHVFTMATANGKWPQAHLHTQWPGSGRPGDPSFDALFATQVQFQADNQIAEQTNADAYVALLDKIGSAHLITHSQAGAFGWRIADQRPKLVKSIVAIEPAGPPFEGQYPFYFPRRPFGLTYQALIYEPDAGPNGEYLQTVTVPAIDKNHTECILQTRPAKKLVNLAEIDVLVVTGEASYHAPYDYGTVQYLRDAGVNVDFLELGKVGIHGNGHMMFLELNNMVIAERLGQWLERHSSDVQSGEEWNRMAEQREL